MPFRRLWLQKNMSGPWFTNAQIPTDVRNPTTDSNTVKSHVVESQADSQGLQGLDRQQHPHFSQTSFPPYGSSGSNYSAFSTTNFSSSTSMRPQLHDSQMRQAPAHPNMTSNHLGPTTQNTNVLNMAKFERPPSFSDAKKMQARTLTQMNNSDLPPNLAEWASSTGFRHQCHMRNRNQLINRVIYNSKPS